MGKDERNFNNELGEDMAEGLEKPSSETTRLLKREWQPMLLRKRQNKQKAESEARGISSSALRIILQQRWL